MSQKIVRTQFSVCVCQPVYIPQTSVGDRKRGSHCVEKREMEEVRHDGYIMMGHNGSVQYVRIISVHREMRDAFRGEGGTGIVCVCVLTKLRVVV